MLEPVIKWSGSKRTQAKSIVDLFPKEIDTYYEPFCGGCSVLFRLLDTNIKVNRYVCSDINSDLIGLWNTIKDYPEDTADYYADLWFEFNQDQNIDRKKQYFERVRDRYNSTHDPKDFLFLTRTSFNGLVRYNSDGKYNSSLHLSRNGIEPKKLRNLLIEWGWVLQENQVKFLCQDYACIQSNEDDVLYLDPPYQNISGMYQGHIGLPRFFDWIRQQKAMYFLSFDGKAGDEDNTYAIPQDIYSQHLYLEAGKSSYRRIVKSFDVGVQESLYIR